MAIWLDVNPRSGVPIYVQIVEQVKHALEVGTLLSGEQLPTVRQLSSELTIAPNTIVKAYNELQQMGLIESRPGAGTVAASNLDTLLKKQMKEDLFKRLREVVRDAHGLGINVDGLSSKFGEATEYFYTRNTDEKGIK